MWFAEVGTIKATKRRIEVSPGTLSVYRQPYRAGMSAREIKRQDVERMLKERIIEHPHAEWARLVVIIPKYDEEETLLH